MRTGAYVTVTKREFFYWLRFIETVLNLSIFLRGIGF